MALFLRKIPLVLFLLIQVCKAVEHNLPEGLEIVDPRSLGLAGADLDKFLGNVKLLPVSGNGLGAKEGPKTQILTVGFEGDEGINLDDFELPSVDNLPDSEKTVAQAAFSRFKDFFKDPTKSKTIVNDEDLLENPLNGDIKKIVTTTPATTTTTYTSLTTSTTPVTSRSRNVYRPRTTSTTPATKTTRVRKIKRPASFRRITTTPATPSGGSGTDFPDEYLQGLGITGGDRRVVEFKPEQFQDYAKIIKELQSMGPRGPPSEVDEGAPIGLLGFKQVNEPGHKGPPIFEFGSSGPSQTQNKPRTKTYTTSSTPTTRRLPSTYYTRGTTKKPTTSYPTQTRYLSNRPHGNAPVTAPSRSFTSPNRFSKTPQLSKAMDSQNSQQSQSEEQSESQEKTKATFEQISAQPIGSDLHSSFRVPFRFPEDEDKQTQYEQIYEQHLITQAAAPQQQQPVAVSPTQLIPIQQQQMIRPTVLTPVISSEQVQYTQQPITGFSTFQAQNQLQLLQQQYQRQQQEQQRRLQQLTEQLKQQQQQSQQLQQQLKIQSQQRPIIQPAPIHYNSQASNSNRAQYFPSSVPSQSIQSQVNYQPQSFPQNPSHIHDHQHLQFRQTPIPVINANTIRPETYQTPNPNYFRPSQTDKYARPIEAPNHIVHNPVSLFGPDAKSPQLIPISTIENVVRPGNPYTPNRFALPPSQQQSQQQQHRHRQPPNHHQVPQSTHQVNHFSQRPHGPPLIHPSHQFAIRSSENAEARADSKGPIITPAALIGTFSLAPQIQQKATSAP